MCAEASHLGRPHDHPDTGEPSSPDDGDYARERPNATRMRRPHAATRARWPQYGAPGQRAKDIATVATWTSSGSRRRPARRTTATTAAAAHRIENTVNALVKPCVSAARRVDPPCSALVIRDDETAERTATPSDHRPGALGGLLEGVRPTG